MALQGNFRPASVGQGFETLLARFDVTENGFLPSSPPSLSLKGPFYQLEEIVESLPQIIRSRVVRHLVDGLPVLSTAALQSREELRRAHVVLGFLAHAYILGDTQNGEEPSQV